MSNPWPATIQHVVNNESVSGPVDSRPTRQLEARSNVLKQRLDDAGLNRTIVDWDATLDPSLLPGMAAFYDTTLQRYTGALAAIETVSGLLATKKSSYAVGIVASKSSSTLGNVILYGRAAVDLTQSVGANAPAGVYYLSATTPGHMVTQSPPISVYVGEYDGVGMMFVRPQVRDFLDSHRHFGFRLTCRPAGTAVQPAVGAEHVITNPDATLPGWLPAGHASFGGTAPAGAVFGYNIAADSGLSKAFPPIPVCSALLFWDKGTNYGGFLVPSGPGGLVIVNAFGIWWMSDGYGNVPWNVNYGTAGWSAASSSSLDRDDSHDRQMSLLLLYSSLAFAGSGYVVTSLTASPHSLLTFVGPDGKPAASGALTASIDIAFTTADTPVAGNTVLKSVAGTVFSDGPVVGRISAGAGITISSANPGASVDGWHQGDLAISTTASLADRELSPTIEALESAKLRAIAGVSVIGLPPARAGGLRVQFAIPAAGLPPSPVVKFRIWLGGTAVGTLPTLALTGLLLPRPASSPVAIPASPATLAWTTTPAVLAIAATYIEIEAAPLAVTAGGLVVFNLLRSATDGYTGEVSILRIAGVIAGG